MYSRRSGHLFLGDVRRTIHRRIVRLRSWFSFQDKQLIRAPASPQTRATRAGSYGQAALSARGRVRLVNPGKVLERSRSNTRAANLCRSYKIRHFRNIATMVGTPKISRKIGNSSFRPYPAFATPTPGWHLRSPAKARRISRLQHTLRQNSCSRRAFPTAWTRPEAGIPRGETKAYACPVPNDEVERREVAAPLNEGDLSGSSIPGLAGQFLAEFRKGSSAGMNR